MPDPDRPRCYAAAFAAAVVVAALTDPAAAQLQPDPGLSQPSPIPPIYRPAPPLNPAGKPPARVVPREIPGAPLPQRAWTATQIDDATLPAVIREETRSPAPDPALPDGLVAAAERGDVSSAWYIDPTRRYAHAVLGDAIEAAGLRVRTADGRELDYPLPQTEVFEDRTPRLADLDADGRTEIVTIRSSLREGASVTVYGVRDGRIVQIAATAFIGVPNRWLNIAGIARFRGGPGLEIAHVRTPHIGGTLIFHAFENGRLVLVARQFGFSNHAIGAGEMRLSAVADVNADGRADLALPGADRQSLRIVTLGPDGLRPIATVPLPAPIDKAIAVQDVGRNAAFIVGLSNGQVFRVGRTRYDPAGFGETPK